MTIQRKREFVLALVVVWLFIAFLFPDTVFPNSWFKRFNSQAVHLQQIQAHIDAIQPQWQTFLKEHPEMSKVQLDAYTGGDGMFAAFGFVPTDAAIVTVSNFMQSTKPPRPIYLEALWVREGETNNAAQSVEKMRRLSIGKSNATATGAELWR
jgi:hypothetical protein